MIEFSFDLTDMLIAAARAADAYKAARMVLVIVPLSTAFLSLFGAVSEKKRRPVGAIALYAMVCAGLFLLGAGDALGDGRYFGSVALAGAACGAIFLTFVLFYAAVRLALRPLFVKEKRYVAEINETPVARFGVGGGLYPLKGGVHGERKDYVSLDYDEFRKFLRKIDGKDLSFSDRMEYNRIVDRAGFLDGVALTEATVADFCGMFSDSVKLGAKYGVE